MADERKNSKTVMSDMKEHMGSLAERIEDLEQLRQQQAGTIRQQLEESSAAVSKIKVGAGLTYMQKHSLPISIASCIMHVETHYHPSTVLISMAC